MWPTEINSGRSIGPLTFIGASTNSHVASYLLGRKKLPRKPAPYITMGGEDEAQEYARRYAAAWANTEGALEWLTARLSPNVKTARR